MEIADNTYVAKWFCFLPVCMNKLEIVGLQSNHFQIFLGKLWKGYDNEDERNFTRITNALCKTSLGYGTYNIILEDSITQPFTYERTSFNAQREVS